MSFIRRFWAQRMVSVGAYLPGADPFISQHHGLGYDYTSGRYILTPHAAARVILVDGTTSVSGQVHHVADLAAGKALQRAGAYGDWLLLPAGGTTMGVYGAWPGNRSASGLNAAYPAVLGTFDPTDPANPAKWLKGRHKFDASGGGPSQLLVNAISNTLDDIAIVGITFRAGLRDEGSQVAMLWLTGGTGLLFDDVVFDRVMSNIQGGAVPAQAPLVAADTSAFIRNVTYNRCGFAYHNSRDAARDGGSFDSRISGLRYQSCINHHGGWSEDHTRATPSWYSNATSGTIACDGIKTIFDFAAAKAHTANTPDPVLIRKVLRSTGAAVNLVAGADYTVAYFETNPVTTGFVVTLLGAPPSSDYDIKLYPRSAGPDIYKHNWYISDEVLDVALIDNIGSWDSCNAKWTGGQYVVRRHTEVRSPMGFIWAAYGNNSWTWPAGGTMDCSDYLQFESCDCNTDVGWVRGTGPWMLMGQSGTRFHNGVLLNQSGGGDKRGIDITANGTTIVSTGVVSNSIFANWRFAPAELTPTAANAARTFDGNVWDEPTSGTNVNRAGLADTDLRDAIAVSLTRNVHTTFRAGQGIPVTVDADPLVTEDRVLAYMARNPAERQWNSLLRTHMLAPIWAAGWGAPLD